MTFGFQQDTLEVRTRNGLDDVLIDELVYLAKDGQLYRAPVGGTTDGFSVPRCLQNIIPATGGDWFSAVLHDSAYRGQLQVCNGVWVKAITSKDRCDRLLLEAMESQGVGLMRYVIYFAVRLFGWAAFKKDGHDK